MDHTGREVMGDAEPVDEHLDDGEPAPVGVLAALRAPEVAALAALLLAGLSLLGLGLLNGSPYVPTTFGPQGPDQSSAVLASAVGAGFAVLPVVVGLAALRRLPRPSHYAVTAGTAVLLGSLSVLLRLVVTARVATEETVPFVQF